ACDQIFQRHSTSEDLGAPESAARQERFQRLDQAALRLRSEVLLDRFWTAPGLDRAGAAGFDQVEVQQGPIGFHNAARRRKSRKLYVAARSTGHRAVSCSKIDTDTSRHAVLRVCVD